ncbi:MAG: glutaredoxin [Solibacterales bacterium]|nr:glutaredoxin [Bryobacterales bacterium]|tara:strand:+ start:5595 stop:5834 length:240 start_codon:yes stop_codon:yes gene_type:complete
MRQVVLYTRPNCHLCEDAKNQLNLAASQLSFSVNEINIEDDPVLLVKYGQDVPVVTVQGQEAFRHHFDGVKLRALLAMN